VLTLSKSARGETQKVTKKKPSKKKKEGVSRAGKRNHGGPRKGSHSGPSQPRLVRRKHSRKNYGRGISGPLVFGVRLVKPRERFLRENKGERDTGRKKMNLKKMRIEADGGGYHPLVVRGWNGPRGGKKHAEYVRKMILALRPERRVRFSVKKRLFRGVDERAGLGRTGSL